MKMHCYFLLNIKHGASVLLGAPAKYNYEPPEGGDGGACLGASLGPGGSPRGASNSLAPALRRARLISSENIFQ